jgi:hypothetical protein
MQLLRPWLLSSIFASVIKIFWLSCHYSSFCLDDQENYLKRSSPFVIPIVTVFALTKSSQWLILLLGDWEWVDINDCVWIEQPLIGISTTRVNLALSKVDLSQLKSLLVAKGLQQNYSHGECTEAWASLSPSGVYSNIPYYLTNIHYLQLTLIVLRVYFNFSMLIIPLRSTTALVTFQFGVGESTSSNHAVRCCTMIDQK